MCSFILINHLNHKIPIEIAFNRAWQSMKGDLIDDDVYSEVCSAITEAKTVLGELEPDRVQAIGFLGHFVFYCSEYAVDGKKKSILPRNMRFYRGKKTANRNAHFVLRLITYYQAFLLGQAPMATREWLKGVFG
jgi:hypothetical protein